MDKPLKPGDRAYAKYYAEPYFEQITRKVTVLGYSPTGKVLVRRGLKARYVSPENVTKVKGKAMNAKKLMPVFITGGILLFLLVIGMWLAGNYNSLITANEDVDNAWSKVETQYQRRFDLVGNLVESVKGSQAQEVKVFAEGIAKSRQQFATGSNEQQAQAASQMETSIAILPRLQEAYPELKSNQNVQKLMDELSGTENSISGVRDKYNDTVTNYNKNVQGFPKNVFASIFGFHQRSQFKAANGAENAPQVKF